MQVRGFTPPPVPPISRRSVHYQYWAKAYGIPYTHLLCLFAARSSRPPPPDDALAGQANYTVTVSGKTGQNLPRHASTVPVAAHFAHTTNICKPGSVNARHGPVVLHKFFYLLPETSGPNLSIVTRCTRDA